MPPKATRTQMTSLRLTPKNYTAVKQAAYDSHRTISNWIEVACMWAIENDVIQTVPRPGDVDGKEASSSSL